MDALKKPLRVQRSRKAGAKLPEGCLCATRPTLFGNPWTGPDAIEAYRRFVWQVMEGVLSIGVVEEGLRVDRAYSTPIAYRRQPPPYIACYCRHGDACHVDQIIRVLTEPLPHIEAVRKMSPKAY